MSQLEESVLSVCDAAQQHMEALPQFYRSCGLLIEVHRFEVQVGLIDLRLQIRGNINGEPVSDSIRTHDSPGGNSRSVLLRGVIGVALANMGNAVMGFLSPRSGQARAYRKAQRLASQDLTRCLDNLIDRPRTFWDRMWSPS